MLASAWLWSVNSACACKADLIQLRNQKAKHRSLPMVVAKDFQDGGYFSTSLKRR